MTDNPPCPQCFDPLGDQEGQICASCKAIAENRPKCCLPIGTVLCGKDFKVGRCLGTGSFGITYLCFQERLDRKVAIKEYFHQDLVQRNKDGMMIPQSPAYADAIKRDLGNYLDEAKILASVEHDNIVSVYQVFEENQTAYIVMQFVKGKRLDKYLLDNGGYMGWKESTELIEPVLEGLKRMHEKALLHLDIKPQNIMVSLEPATRAILIDFGAARYLGPSTTTRSVQHTKSYAAPEVLLGKKAREMGFPTDIYSVGATLFHMVTGNPPRTQEDHWLDPLLNAHPKIPDRFVIALESALEIEPNRRPQDVAALKELLEAAKLDAAQHTLAGVGGADVAADRGTIADVETADIVRKGQEWAAPASTFDSQADTASLEKVEDLCADETFKNLDRATYAGREVPCIHGHDIERKSGGKVMAGIEDTFIEIEDILLLSRLRKGLFGEFCLGIDSLRGTRFAVEIIPPSASKGYCGLWDGVNYFINDRLRFAAKYTNDRRLFPRNSSLETIHFAGKSRGLYFIVKAFLPGQSLSNSLEASGVLHERDALEIATDVAFGLEELHGRFLIHATLTASSVWLPCYQRTGLLVPVQPPAPRAMLSDLELAREELDGHVDTALLSWMIARRSEILSEPFSPEHTASSQELIVESDFFCLGAVLYHMLVGKPPFVAEPPPAQQMLAGLDILRHFRGIFESEDDDRRSMHRQIVLRKDHVPILDLRPDVSRATAEVVDRCLMKKPEDRYREDADLIRELWNCLEECSHRRIE